MASYECACGYGGPFPPGRRSCPGCGRALARAGDETTTLVGDAGTQLDAGDTAAAREALPRTAESVRSQPGGPTTPDTPVEAAQPAERGADPCGPAGDADAGRVLGPYRRLDAVRPWRYGTIYRAHHPLLDRHVQLRVLAPEHAGDPIVRAQFLTAAQSLARLSHPNVLGVLEASAVGPEPYIAEELAEGRPPDGFGPRTWRERWSEGLYPARALHRAMLDAARGLGVLHAAGIAHGQLCSDSFLVDHSGTVKIIGIAELGTSRREFGGRLATRGSAIQQDIYDLGAMFYRLATGLAPPVAEVPHSDGTLRGPAAQAGSVRDLRSSAKRLNPGLSRETCAVFARCLAADPAERYADCAELARDLERLLEWRAARCGWPIRVFTLMVDIFLGLVAWVLVAVPTMLVAQLGDWRAAAGFALLLALPFLYPLLLESILGWTPGRRLFGLTLGDFAGDPPRAWRRAVRALVRLAVLLAAWAACSSLWFAVPAEYQAVRLGVLSAALILGPACGLLLLYAPARWIASRIPPHDLACGAILIERFPVAADFLAARLPAPDASEPSQATDLLGVVDQYELRRRIGSGGMGSVFLARDRSLGRDVALKVLSEPLMGDELQVQRFHREARLAAQVNHPHVAKVYGTGRWEKSPYIALEFIDGPSLQQLVDSRGPPPIDEAWRYITQAAEGLREASRRGVVHRDIKPSNLMVTQSGTLKITDFGISRETTSNVSLTQTGTLVGTPLFMSPEQAMGKPVDARSDIYSLGMTLHFLLTGRPPFEGSNPMEILAQQISADPPSLEGKVPGLNEARASIVRRMMAKNKEERYPNYASLIADLHRESPHAAPPAGVRARLAAESINWGLLALLMLLGSSALGLVALWILQSRGFERPAWGFWSNVAGWLVVIEVAYLARVCWGVARHGALLGQQILGLRVTRCDGRRLGLARALLRFLLTYPSYPVLLLSAAGFVGEHVLAAALAGNGLWLAASGGVAWRQGRGRGIPDLMTDTMVVAVPGSPSHPE